MNEDELTGILCLIAMVVIVWMAWDLLRTELAMLGWNYRAR